MSDSINKFFCETYILIKQVKHISKILAIRVEVLREIIYTDIVDSITSTRYHWSGYDLHLINYATYTTTKVLFKEKSQVKIRLLKYMKNMQIQYDITI